MSENKPFQRHDAEFEEDKNFIDSIGDRIPTDEEWKECRKIWTRTLDRLINLSLIAEESQNRN